MTNRIGSPFSDRGTITDPKRFFGRAKEKQQIFNQLASPKPQSVAIIGERRIGRSSLLKNVEQSFTEVLPGHERYDFGYLSLDSDTIRTPNQFYGAVAKELFGTAPEELAPGRFDDLLTSYDESGATRYVLLLDEFNVLQRRKEAFDDDFYDGLRSRINAQSPKLAIVLASHVPLEEVAVQNDFSSTFFGIFYTVDLGPFSVDEARAAVLRECEHQLEAPDFRQVQQWVEEVYHPLKLNVGANLVWMDSPDPDYEALKAEFEKQVAHIFGDKVKEKRQEKLDQAEADEAKDAGLISRIKSWWR
ncbi:MAG: hypothetical protein AB8G95_28285 [Anaerolineae bacterium]